MANPKLKGGLRVSVLKPELSTHKSKRYEAKNRLSRNVDHDRRGIEVLLNLMNLVTADCETALLSTNHEIRRDHIRSAKKSYAVALRWAGRLSFSVDDVNAFGLCAVRLENVVSKLEEQYVNQEVEPRCDRSQASSDVSP
jgi:hypothetical protein